MALDNDQLEKLLKKGNPAKVVAFFRGATEEERRGVAAIVIAWCQRLSLQWRGQFEKKAAAKIEREGAIENWRELLPAAIAAALASATIRELRTLEHLRSASDADAIEVLADRQPDWLDEYGELLCEGELTTFGGNWQAMRSLVRAGIIRPPRHEHYVLRALNGIWPPHKAGAQRPPLADLLRAESDWLESDFWRLFEHDGNGEVSFTSCEKYNKSKETWTGALLQLSREGVLSRERLLESSLSALSRDFIQYRAGWFSRFHEAMEPTPEERTARIEAYLGLLGSSIPPTVAFAVQAVAIVEKHAPQPASKLTAALAPVLNARGKAVVKSALQILDAAARREPGRRQSICLSVVPALLNEAPEVQKSVFDFLDRHGDPKDAKLCGKVGEIAEAVAASLRARLVPWSGGGSKVMVVPSGFEPAGEKPEVASRTDPTRKIVPINDLDELIHAASAMLEDPANPDEIERVIDGVSRLCDQRPEDFAKRTRPLFKRAAKKESSWVLDRVLSRFLIAWTEGVHACEAPNALARGWNQYAFLLRRLQIVGEWVRKQIAMPLLSAPTHLGGWIEPSVLVERWRAWEEASAPMDPYEQVLALLRLAPEGREVALKAASGLSGGAGEALRFALGEQGKTGKDAAIWLAAWRSRQPVGDLPEFEAIHPGLGPDAGVGARYSWSAGSERRSYQTTEWITLAMEFQLDPRPPKSVQPNLLPVLFHRDWETSGEGGANLIRWAMQLWPANRESILFRGAERLYSSVIYGDALDRDHVSYLEPLADSHTELRPVACLVLALGLAAQDSALRGLAQDGLVAAISEGRLDIEELGGTMSRLLASGYNKFARWAKGLREVARVSRVHARETARLLIRTLRGDAARAPRDVNQLLEVLLEMLSETGGHLHDEPARQYLAALTSGGKTGKLVKQILSLS